MKLERQARPEQVSQQSSFWPLSDLLVKRSFGYYERAGVGKQK